MSLSTRKFEKEAWHGEVIGLDRGEVRVPVLCLAINRLEIINRQQDGESAGNVRITGGYMCK